jgi:Lysyl oxidase/Secretion system C-terminal sorting domain
MKKLLLITFLLLLKVGAMNAQCPSGESEVVVLIQPDNYPGETSWDLRDLNGNIISSGDSIGDTVCIPTGSCLIFRIQDTYGDGICCGFGNGFYAVYVNGAVQAAGGQFTYSETSYINCPAGSHCGSAFAVNQDTLISSPGNSTWYSFTPDTTGTFNISTCFASNTCDTRVWVYDHCTGLIWNDDMAGTIYYNDSACGIQAYVSAAFQAGSTYYIRIGGDSTCAGDTVDFQITYGGPIVGCTDPAACNFNPLATVSNGNCIYPGDPLCNSGPDLIVDGQELTNSLSVGTVNGNDVCLIGEGCLSGYGVRDVINFSTRIANIGDADYYIGQPASGNTQFVFDQCHGHWHYAGYAMYNIYDSLGVPLQAGFKNGFCVLDLQCFGGTAKYGCGNMGISAGCADIYGAGLACQWLDITTIPAGRYTLVVRVNWDQDPDKLGRQEQRFDNNVAAVCLNITRNAQNVPSFTMLPNCQPLIDCAGDTFGLATYDCMGNCNGTRVRGDLDIDNDRDDTDVMQYLTDVTAQSGVLPCNDVNGDGQLTATDAALVSGCIRSTNGNHGHQGGTQLTHRHCEFPWNILNINDTVRIGINSVHQDSTFIDLDILNPDCRLLAYDFTMTGVTIDSIVSIYNGFDPVITFDNSTGRIVILDTMEVSLTKQLVATKLLRVYYSALTSNTICISNVNSSVNADYEETMTGIFNGCVTVTGINILYQSGMIKVMPNPSTDVFTVSSDMLNGTNAVVTVTDAMGRVVLSRREVIAGGKGFGIDLQNYPKGVYLLRISTDQMDLTEKLLKL